MHDWRRVPAGWIVVGCFFLASTSWAGPTYAPRSNHGPDPLRFVGMSQGEMLSTLIGERVDLSVARQMSRLEAGGHFRVEPAPPRSMPEPAVPTHERPQPATPVEPAAQAQARPSKTLRVVKAAAPTNNGTANGTTQDNEMTPEQLFDGIPNLDPHLFTMVDPSGDGDSHRQAAFHPLAQRHFHALPRVKSNDITATLGPRLRGLALAVADAAASGTLGLDEDTTHRLQARLDSIAGEHFRVYGFELIVKGRDDFVAGAHNYHGDEEIFVPEDLLTQLDSQSTSLGDEFLTELIIGPAFRVHPQESVLVRQKLFQAHYRRLHARQRRHQNIEKTHKGILGKAVRAIIDQQAHEARGLLPALEEAGRGDVAQLFLRQTVSVESLIALRARAKALAQGVDHELAGTAFNDVLRAALALDLLDSTMLDADKRELLRREKAATRLDYARYQLRRKEHDAAVTLLSSDGGQTLRPELASDPAALMVLADGLRRAGYPRRALRLLMPSGELRKDMEALPWVRLMAAEILVSMGGRGRLHEALSLLVRTNGDIRRTLRNDGYSSAVQLARRIRALLAAPASVPIAAN